MRKGLVGLERELCEAFVKKAKEQGYEKDVCIIGCGIALCQQNPNDPCDTFQTLINLIDECKDEEEFLQKATDLLDLDLG